MGHILMVLKLLLLLLLLSNCILLFFNLGVIIALANVNPCVGVNENLVKNSKKKDFRKNSHQNF